MNRHASAAATSRASRAARLSAELTAAAARALGIGVLRAVVGLLTAALLLLHAATSL